MRTKILFFPSALLTALMMVWGSAANATSTTIQAPGAGSPADPNPSEIVKKLALQPAPELAGKGEAAQKSARAFIDWAGASTQAQDDTIRRMLAVAAGNADIVSAFCSEALASQQVDHDRALVVLGLLGEMRSPQGLDCLAKFVSLPLPEKGTLVDGEIIEQTALATLQAKAIDGLAYLKNDQADRIVLDAVAKNPSRIVRAEAIAAYIWNHDNSPRAQAALKSVVHKDELIFMDRVVRQAGDKAESFNQKLATYLKAHPEVNAPKPTKAEASRKPVVGQPPKF